MLLLEEWLPRAQKLYVGQSIRVQHQREHRLNLQINNDKGSWWAYCHACGAHGSVLKTHVLLGGSAPVVDVNPVLPDDLVLAIVSEFASVVAEFLATKNMDYMHLPDVFLSIKAKRILIKDDAGNWHGRDMTGVSSAKWLHYNNTRFVGTPKSTTIITEDLFSMYKMQHAIGPADIAVCSTLGAKINQTAKWKLRDCKHLIYAYDADAAGDSGYTEGCRILRPFGIKQSRLRPDEGQDPKDMQGSLIRHLLREIIHES